MKSFSFSQIFNEGIKRVSFYQKRFFIQKAFSQLGIIPDLIYEGHRQGNKESSEIKKVMISSFNILAATALRPRASRKFSLKLYFQR